MEINPAEYLPIVVLCPSVAPEAHGPGCSYRHLFIPPQPGEPGDWSGTVTDLDQVRERFPGVLFHKCLLDAIQYGILRANAIAAGREPRPSDPEHKPRGEHPYGRA
ncbi:hypothetical protein [Nonomuraea sp. NEAU-A123]|uniref:hypothetical protein n=1 Tax=Nonomuraea sp. NEAU-A123 TaxID=2839649 RepID=UPI001BE3E0C9|nr:hypothetical protein [Nonomuraea sp. NEAU-A123]MBT2233221.1 hypothetical protein [Nonomuraea sp. NEAU-A123]